MSNDRHINFKLLRTACSGADEARTPKQYWRNLEEMADSPVSKSCAPRISQQAEEWNDPVERRTFLKLMGASLALAG
jgi:molybdopterin-containing oxidoreductase family iron-sulfur binding subunit